MLPKSRRIPRKSFKPLLESRKYSNSGSFTLRSAPSDAIRVAVSVSKKVSKKAVVRNRIRRRTYSAMKNLVPSLKPGLYLVIAKPGAEKMKGEALESELANLFKKV